MKRSAPAQARSSKWRVYVVDDHPITRAGLVRLIEREKDFEVSGEAATAAVAVSEIATLQPDLVVVDISLAGGPSGLELTKDVAVRCRGVKMLALSTYDEALYAERALRAGARGFVMKQEPIEVILLAIRQVLHGEIYLSSALNERLINKLFQPGTTPTLSQIDRLTDRELEVYRLLGKGRTTRSIAAQLRVSISTVESYRAHLKQKLHLRSSAELLRRAVEWVHAQGA